MTSTYLEFAQQSSSEKEGLVILEASRRLLGWVLHFGSVYKIENFPHQVLAPEAPIADTGAVMSSVGSAAAVTAGTYYFDRLAKVLYLATSDEVNPNGKFISCTFRLHFSRGGAKLPHDPSDPTSFKVYWAAMVQGVSDFTYGLDNRYQLGQAIEGQGSITLSNKQEYWRPIFDRYYFDNKRVLVYSWSPTLPVNEAKLIFKGRCSGKSYSFSSVQFKLTDNLSELRSPIPLEDLEDYPGARVPESLANAKQRRLFGYLFGNRPTNIDQVLDGYPLTGLFSAENGSTALVGSGTDFLTSLTPGDSVVLGSDDETFKATIESITDDENAVLTEEYSGATKALVAGRVIPSHPKTYMNRRFLIAGHQLRQPETTVVNAFTTRFFEVADATDIRPGETILVAGERTRTLRVSGNFIVLSQALETVPLIGDPVIRPPVTAAYLDKTPLIITRDYTVDPVTAIFTLTPTAEINLAPVVKLTGTLDFTTSSKVVTGTGTNFTSELKPGDFIRAQGEANYFEVFKVDSDDSLQLRTPATYTLATWASYAKKPAYYVEGSSIVSIDTLGATVDGLTTGALIKTGPQIVEQLLTDIGLADLMDVTSFTASKALTETILGVAIPDQFSSRDTPSARDVINRVNQSDFGSLVQSADFQLRYNILRPQKNSLVEFMENDALQFSIDANSDRIAAFSNVNYLIKEVDAISGSSSRKTATGMSKSANYLAQTTREFSIDTLLVFEGDAQIFANRWAFIFELAAAIIKISTKLQGSRIQIGDVVKLKHEKLYDRVGSSSRQKIASVQSVQKSLDGATLELEDLANAFSRCATITEDDAPNWDDSSEDQQALNGFITDDYGMQGNVPDTAGVNLIW